MTTQPRIVIGPWPGPWTAERHEGDDGSVYFEIWNPTKENYLFITAVYEDHNYSEAQQRATANLIAASPDLFDALQEMLYTPDAPLVPQNSDGGLIHAG